LRFLQIDEVGDQVEGPGDAAVLEPGGHEAVRSMFGKELRDGCAATNKVRLSVKQDETRRRGCDEGRA
jgi:hypothetical protein